MLAVSKLLDCSCKVAAVSKQLASLFQLDDKQLTINNKQHLDIELLSAANKIIIIRGEPISDTVALGIEFVAVRGRVSLPRDATSCILRS